METAMAILTGLFFATALYLMLSKHIIRVLLGVAVLGNAVNLTIFTTGRITREVPPIIPDDAVVPMDAIKTFVDPSVEFGLRFDSASDDDEDEDSEELSAAPGHFTHEDEDDDDAADENHHERKSGDVVSLDQFRK